MDGRRKDLLMLWSWRFELVIFCFLSDPLWSSLVTYNWVSNVSLLHLISTWGRDSSWIVFALLRVDWLDRILMGKVLPDRSSMGLLLEVSLCIWIFLLESFSSSKTMKIFKITVSKQEIIQISSGVIVLDIGEEYLKSLILQKCWNIVNHVFLVAKYN